MRVFTTLLSPAEARARYLAARSRAPLGAETVPLDQALDRVLTADLVAGEDLPPFDRSTVDGFAVRAADVEQGDESAPVRLRLGGGDRAGTNRWNAPSRRGRRSDTGTVARARRDRRGSPSGALRREHDLARRGRARGRHGAACRPPAAPPGPRRSVV